MSVTFSGTPSKQIEKRVRYLSIGFFCFSCAFLTSQGVQSLIHRDHGYLNLGVFYFAFAFVSLVIPMVLQGLAQGSNGGLVLNLAAAVYVVVIVSNIFTQLPWWVLTILFGFNGVAAALIWVGQMVVLSKLSTSYRLASSNFKFNTKRKLKLLVAVKTGADHAVCAGVQPVQWRREDRPSRNLPLQFYLIHVVPDVRSYRHRRLLPHHSRDWASAVRSAHTVISSVCGGLPFLYGRVSEDAGTAVFRCNRARAVRRF